MAALRPFSKCRPGKRPASAIDILSSDDESEELVLVAEGRKEPKLTSDSETPELVFLLETPAGPAAPIPIRPGTRVALRGAGTSGVDGSYASYANEDGTFGFRREGGGDFALAWWEEEPGAWKAGWYVFAVETEEGVYCCSEGDEAHFPLSPWRIYTGPESRPGGAPPPRGEPLGHGERPLRRQQEAAARLLDVAAGAALLLHAAGTAEVNGTYVAEADGEGGLRFAKEGDGRFAIAWWEEQPGQWTAGWYVFATEAEEGIYFSQYGDQTHLPLGTAWKVYSGPDGRPGLEPPPRADARSSLAGLEACCELVYVKAGLKVQVAGAGSKAVDGTYVAAFGEDGALKFNQQGDGAYAIGWWDAEPGQWRAGWYIFTADAEEGVYCLGEGDEARFPLGTWEVYSGPESRPGLAPAPRTTSLQAAVDARAWRDQLETGWQGFRKGAAVELNGLQAAPALNGQHGRLVCFDPESLRWQVQLDGDRGTKSIRPANLILRPDEEEEEAEGIAEGASKVPRASCPDVQEGESEPEEVHMDAGAEGPRGAGSCGSSRELRRAA